MQIIQERNPWEPLAQGFAQGMQGLVQGYTKGQERKSLSKAFETMGYTRDEAKALAVMPEHLQQEFIKVKAKAPQRDALKSIVDKYGLQGAAPQEQQSYQAQPSQQMESPIAAAMQGMGQQQPQAPANLGIQLSQLAQQQKQDLLNKMMGGQPQFGQPQMGPQMQGLQGLMGGMQNLPQAMNQDLMQRTAQNQYPEPQPQAPQAASLQQQAVQPTEQPVSPRESTAIKRPSSAEMRADSIALAAQGTPDAIAMSKSLNHMADAQDKVASEAWKNANKSVKGFVEKERAAEDQLSSIEEMRQLDKTGKLDKPGRVFFAELIDKLTGISGAGTGMLSSDSQVFNKVRAGLLKGLSKEFGGKVAVVEMESFMKKFPSLMNSKEGREKIYRLFEVQQELANVDVKAAQNVIDNNGGYPPQAFDLDHAKEARRLRRELTDARALEVNQIIGAEKPQQQASKLTTKTLALGVDKVPEGRVVYTKDGRAMKKVNGQMVPA